MDTLFSLKVFVKVVEHGSFTKAANALDISTAMASKHVSHVEKRVNTRLLNRTSRSVSPTSEGEIYYSQCLEALNLITKAEHQISSGIAIPKGELRIAAPVWCACPTFANWIVEYQAQFPEVSVDLVLDNAMTDLASDNFDLALRVNDTLSPSLIARPLMYIPFVLVASPSHLNKNGTPDSAKALEQYPFVLPSYVDISQFSYKTAEGVGQILQLETKCQSNNTVMLKELVLAGSGIGYLPLWLVEDAIESGELTQLFADEFVDDVCLHAIYLSRRHLSAKIRSFIDFMVDKPQ